MTVQEITNQDLEYLLEALAVVRDNRECNMNDKELVADALDDLGYGEEAEMLDTMSIPQYISVLENEFTEYISAA